MPRLGKWRVIVYQGSKDVKLDDYATREQAAQALQDYISNKSKQKKTHAQDLDWYRSHLKKRS